MPATGRPERLALFCRPESWPSRVSRGSSLRARIPEDSEYVADFGRPWCNAYAHANGHLLNRHRGGTFHGRKSHRSTPNDHPNHQFPAVPFWQINLLRIFYFPIAFVMGSVVWQQVLFESAGWSWERGLAKSMLAALALLCLWGYAIRCSCCR